MSRVACLVLIAVVGVGLVGCNRPYVNIPAQRGDVAAHDPNATNVREAEVAALRGALLDDPIEGPVAIGLPTGTSPLTYAAVLPQVSEQAVKASEAEPGVARLTVKQVRIRGWEGEVDIVRDTGSRMPQLVTVYLDYAPFSGWSFNRIRTWRGTPDETLPGPSAEPAPEETL